MLSQDENKAHLQEINEEIYRRNLELAFVNKTLSLLRKLYQISLLTLDPASLSKSISETVRRELNMEVVGVFFYDEKNDSLTPYKFSQSARLSGALAKAELVLDNLKINDVSKRPLLKHAMQDKKSVSVNTLSEVWRDTTDPAKLDASSAESHVKTILLYPLVTQHKVIGLLLLGLNRDYQILNNFEKESIKSCIDVTAVALDKALLYEQLNEVNQDLEDANLHLQELDQAKTEFVSIASHQLRTPMTGIMGYLSMMTQGDFGKIKTEHQKILTDLLDESQRMIRLINLFLNVSKIEAGKFEMEFSPVKLEEIIEGEMQEVKKAAAEKKLKLNFDKPKQSLPLVRADADKIKDVMLNLLDNAIKYTAKGSVIVLTEVGDREVTVKVKDTGIGIKPRDAKELFNKFVRATGIARIHPDGSGLGLFIAKKIVEAQGGKIWVESEGEGKGSTFQFTVPIAS